MDTTTSTAVLAAGMHVAAALLVLAGGAKLARPRGTRTALRLAGLPSRTVLVRLLGVTELAVGVAVLSWSWRPAVLALALLYAAFAVFAARQRRADAGCGCFGDETAPVSALHVAVNLALALCVGITVAVPVPGLPALLPAAALPALATVAGVAMVAALLRLALTALPELADALTLTNPEVDR